MIIGIKLAPIVNIGLSAKQLLNLLVYFFLVNTLALEIFFKGLKYKFKRSIVHTYLAIVLKFLFYLGVIGVIWYIKDKKLEKSFVISFFIMYLGYSFVLIFIFGRFLKLKKD